MKQIDKDGNEVYSTTYTTDIEELITYYQQIVETTPGVIVRDEKTYYQPFTLVAKKEGKQDLIIPNNYIVKGQSTILRGKMVDTIPPVYYQQAFEGQLINTDEFTGQLITITEFKGELKL